MRTLERGFALVYDCSRKTVSSTQQLQQKMPLLLKFKDGEREVIVANRRAGTLSSRTGSGPARRQGTLL